MKSDHLFKLIKSLDGREKRHFSLQEGIYRKAGGSLSRQLFHLIEKQEVYDEAELQTSLCVAQPQRQLHVLKNQLYHQILDSLIGVRGEKHPTDRINSLIRKGRILQEKKLYAEANRFLHRANKLAEKLEQFEQLLLIYKHWKRLYAWILEVDKRAEHIARFWKKEQEALAKLANLRELEWVSMQVFDLYYRVHYAHNAEQVEQYRTLMQHPLLEHEDRALSVSARVVFLNTHGLYEDAIGRQERCLIFRQQLVALYQTHPDLLRESFSQYLAAYNNYLLGLIHLNRYDEAKMALAQLEQLPAQIQRKMKNSEQVMWFRSFYSLRLEVFIRTGDFKSALDTIPSTLQQFEQLDKDLNPAFRWPFQYFFAYTHFALGQYDAALDFLTPLIHQVELSFKQELFRFARTLQLIIHFERSDFALLPSLIRSTRRHLQKQGGTFVLEELILKFLNKAPHAAPRSAFQRLQAAVLSVDQEVLSPQMLHHFHFLSWIKSNLEKRTFTDTYQDFLQ